MSYAVTIDSNEMTCYMNQGIDVFLDGMEKDGLITEKQYNEMLRYRVAVHEPGFWGSIWKKLYNGNTSDSWMYSLVRLTSHIDEIDEHKDDE